MDLRANIERSKEKQQQQRNPQKQRKKERKKDQSYGVLHMFTDCTVLLLHYSIVCIRGGGGASLCRALRDKRSRLAASSSYGLRLYWWTGFSLLSSLLPPSSFFSFFSFSSLVITQKLLLLSRTYIHTHTYTYLIYTTRGREPPGLFLILLYYSLPLPPTALPVCRLRVFSCAPFGRLDQWVLVVHRRLLQTVAFLEPVQSSLHPYPLVILFYFHRQRHWFSFSFEIEIEQHWPMCVVLITQGISMLDCELISI